MFLSAVLLSCLLLGYASGQELSCRALNVDQEADNPFSGSALDVCRTDAAQCCSQRFLDGVRREIREDLLEGLRDELTNRVGDVQDILDRFGSYFESDFIEGIRGNIPVARFLTNVEDITSALTMFLNRATFAITSDSPERNTTEIFVRILEQIEGAIRNIDSSILSDMQKECVIQELREHVSQSSLLTLGRTLEVLRRSFSGITRIVQFLIRFTRNLDGFTFESFPTQCLNRFTELSICGRCRSRIAPLCRNSCGALVRGCFAAFYSGLEREFDNLWAVLRQLVETAARGVRELFQAENDLLDIDVLQVASDCSIDLTGLLGRKKRQVAPEPLLPEAIMTRAQTLSGVFKYALSGPRFCELDSDEEDFCGGGEGGSEDRSCDPGEVCTSTCQCWDGMEMRETDVTEFTGVGIEDQDGNPVLRVPEEENLKIATGRSSVVNRFLTSEEFTEVMPEGVTIPPPATFGGDGSVPLVISMVTILGTVLFALLMVGV